MSSTLESHQLHRKIAEDGLILLATVGSTAHGLNLPGADDHDQMGVCIEPKEWVIGLRHFEQDVYRTKPDGERSGPGDVDRTIYSLRKFCRLALSGNPSILTLLFVRPQYVRPQGESLQSIAFAFAARSAGKAFLGYMTQQRQRLLGERGQMNVKRPELVDEHGYDTKYAMHMLRLGFQGVEFLETGKLSLPIAEEERAFILAVRKGEVDLNDVLTQAGDLERRVEDLLDTSPLPPKPDSDYVNRWLVGAYTSAWAGR
jgi:predicted nucleotidyltransferase